MFCRFRTFGDWSVHDGGGDRWRWSCLFKGPNAVSTYTDVYALTDEQIKAVIAELERRGHWCMTNLDVRYVLKRMENNHGHDSETNGGEAFQGSASSISGCASVQRHETDS